MDYYSLSTSLKEVHSTIKNYARVRYLKLVGCRKKLGSNFVIKKIINREIVYNKSKVPIF